MTGKKRQYNNGLKEEGTVLVESALTLAVFLLVIMGVVEMGRLLQFKNAVTEAARDGARFAICPEHDPDEGTWNLPEKKETIEHVEEFLGKIMAGDASKVKVSVDPDFPFPGDSQTTCTKVTVEVPYQVLSPIIPFSKISVSAESIMRNETSD